MLHCIDDELSTSGGDAIVSQKSFPAASRPRPFPEALELADGSLVVGTSASLQDFRGWAPVLDIFQNGLYASVGHIAVNCGQSTWSQWKSYSTKTSDYCSGTHELGTAATISPTCVDGGDFFSSVLNRFQNSHGIEINSTILPQQAEEISQSFREAILGIISSYPANFKNIGDYGGLSVESPNSDAVNAVKRLREIKSWGENWDAEGAPAPDDHAINSAILLCGFLGVYLARLRVALDALGRPMILLTKDGREAEIIVNDQAEIEFVVSGTGLDAADCAKFDGKTLPRTLSYALFSAGFCAA